MASRISPLLTATLPSGTGSDIHIMLTKASTNKAENNTPQAERFQDTSCLRGACWTQCLGVFHADEPSPRRDQKIGACSNLLKNKA